MDDVRVVVLTYQGKVFGAEADIRACMGRFAEPGDHRQNGRTSRKSSHCLMKCKKPVICALNGPALRAGLAVVASCDIFIASEKGSLGVPEINAGLLGGGGRAIRLFGHSLTRRMMFTGYRVSASELYRLGVIEAVTAPDDLMDAAMDMARDIASKSPIAMNLAKHSLNTIEKISLCDGYRFEQGITNVLGQYEDLKEAMRAFAEKRPPVFKGR